MARSGDGSDLLTAERLIADADAVDVVVLLLTLLARLLGAWRSLLLITITSVARSMANSIDSAGVMQFVCMMYVDTGETSHSARRRR